MTLSDFIKKTKKRFDMRPYKEPDDVIIQRIADNATYRGANIWVLIFAIFIASLGLNVNSTAVIIGAMLISPLMGPIIGMGLSVGINDPDLLQRSLKNYGVSTLISIVTATIYFLLTPLGEAQSELLARTSPTLYDVLIAFCGGAAGIITLCTGGKGNVIPGVAIATALMPPLCTAGYGIATAQPIFFFGAFYLFFINTVFIALATYLGVRFMKFKKHNHMSYEQKSKASRIIAAIVFLTMIPAICMTVNIVRQNFLEKEVRKFIKAELVQPGTRIISSDATKDKMLTVVAVGKELEDDFIQKAEERLSLYGHLKDFSLKVIQGSQSDSIDYLNNVLSTVSTDKEAQQRQLMELSSQATLLNSQLQNYVKYEELSREIKDELPILFPQIKTISLSNITEERLDSVREVSYIAAIIGYDKKHISNTDKTTLRKWLKMRIDADSLVIIEK